ncbi:hypothetical protein HRW18_05355 [Streptomyces lunaelactis]|uniref:hypothetical protein n=1 Tax=Streptomyces lunaelactis TaxID=1535768 RepID=UPI00158485A3|nr:hypothetical protein [Streptomyces lunaelactis]NUK07449.1 hypothetical protein [Streptomyces lunaelactis]
MRQICDWCGNEGNDAITVGIAHANSGPGRNLYACPPCKTAHRLLPLDQHPAESFGFPRFDYAATAAH